MKKRLGEGRAPRNDGGRIRGAGHTRLALNPAGPACRSQDHGIWLNAAARTALGNLADLGSLAHRYGSGLRPEGARELSPGFSLGRLAPPDGKPWRGVGTATRSTTMLSP